MTELRTVLQIMNPHWENGFKYDYPLKRTVFADIEKQLDHMLIVSLTGPRRTGKTTLMKQVINKLIENDTTRMNVLFFSFDDEAGDPIDIVKVWESIIGKKARGPGFMIFFDEIQKCENWAAKIKILYDNLNVKIFVSGSASMEIKKGSESLAGRVFEFCVPPISYAEYLLLAGREEETIELLAWDDYVRYMDRQLPELATSSTLNPSDYVSSIVKKVIYEDMKKQFNVEMTDVIDGMFRVICKDPGQIIAINDFAKDFGIDRATASEYLSALEKSFLVRKLYNFSRNARKSEVRAKKYYPHYTSLMRYSIGPASVLSKAIETEVAWKSKAEFFWNEDNRKEIDFIAGTAESLIGIEVKMSKRIERTDLKWLLENDLKLKRLVVVAPIDSRVEVGGIEIVRPHKLDQFVESFNSS